MFPSNHPKPVLAPPHKWPVRVFFIAGVVKMIEEDEIQLLKRDLERYFHIKEEVKGRHIEGFNVRIDALICPKDHALWRNKNKTLFGIEYKKQFESISDRTKLIVQAMDYRNSKFPTNFGNLYGPIFIYPNPIISLEDRMFYDRFLGRLGIGFLDYEEKYDGRKVLTMRLSGTNIWNSDTGVSGVAKNMKFERKVGAQ